MQATWIKLFISIFSNPKIITLLKERDGDTYFRVWIQLLTIAGQSMQQGKLMMSENKPMTSEDLAKIMSKSNQKMKKILNKLIELGMIIYSENTYIIKNWNEYQSLDKYEKHLEVERNRQQRFRDRKKEERNVMQTLRNTIEEMRKETEEDKDREKENIKAGENNSGFKPIDF